MFPNNENTHARVSFIINDWQAGDLCFVLLVHISSLIKKVCHIIIVL